jgi:hypothetical protein
MQLEEAKTIVAQEELNRWRNFVARGQPIAKPRIFALSDLSQNAVVETISGPLQVPRHLTNAAPEWCFFADDLPNANWEHPCRYLVVYSDGSIQSVDNRVPPNSTANAPIEEVFPFAL